MHIDFKVTTWERVEIPEGKEKEVLSKIKDGSISSGNDLFDLFNDDGNLTCDKLDDTDEPMTPEENGGSSTMEVWEQVTLEGNKPMECTWNNGAD